MTNEEKQDIAAECRRLIAEASKEGAGYRTVAKGKVAEIALAALTAQPRAWFTDDAETDKSATTYSAEVAERWCSKQWPVTPLFTASPVPEDWQQRAEAAEAKLAELEKQESVPTKLKYSSVLPKFIGDTDEVESYHCMIHGSTPDRKTMEEAYADAKQMCGNLFTRPAPAVSLVELVPDENPPDEIMMLKSNSIDASCKRGGVINGWAACRAAILRNIEEAK